LPVSKLEKSIGIEVYFTSSLGIGGRIKQYAEDFVVEEVLVNGSKAEVNLSKKSVRGEALGISLADNRYLLCVLVKRNWDTFSALHAIAKQLGINTKQIQIAGIKDAKAATAQHITVEGVSAEDLQKIHLEDIEIRPTNYFRSKLSSYYLLENHFHITIRAISHSESIIKRRITKTVEELEKAGGVPNFFGHQRFGTIRPITHLVGKSLVQGRFKEAAMLFLAKPSQYEHPESRKAREQLQATGDFKQALTNFPKQLRYERLMLKRLARKQDDFVGAFRMLPTKLRRLFPQAYQSYFFNKFLSRRIVKGLLLNRAEAGDYVVNVERFGLPMLKMRRTVSPKTVAEINKAIQAGKMRLAIPLVGFKQQPSKGLEGEIEKQILQEEEISLEKFRICDMLEISVRGGLRTALVPLNNFVLNEITQDSANSSKNKAELSFSLGRGSYATVVLRELMKPSNPVTTGF